VIGGIVAPGFENVRSAFERCFAELGETGASFHAFAGGRTVADLWGGDGFARDSLVQVYSVTKPAAAFCVLVLADRGRLGLDDRVAAHWPEFAAAGKEPVTVRQLLAHQAGLVALREPQPASVLLDHARLAGLLAAESPWFEPGSAHGEHALFYGHLCGELVRRVDGRTLGTFWREEVAEPWRLDFHIGLRDAELERVADLAGAFPAADGGELYAAALGNPPGARDLTVVNGAAWRRAEIPAVNGHASAAGVARFFEGLRRGAELEGVRLVAPAAVDAMSAGELRAHDAVIGDEICWGLGVWVDSDGWGMGGVGGSLGMTDPDLGLAEAYVTRAMGTHDRADLLDAAVREAIAA
jgi:CubicO group peptidase (beta-lactamase class C family)